MSIDEENKKLTEIMDRLGKIYKDGYANLRNAEAIIQDEDKKKTEEPFSCVGFVLLLLLVAFCGGIAYIFLSVQS